MPTKYSQGRDTEYLAIDQLERDGWKAQRSAGSHKEADVIAWCEHGTRYIQCKRYTDRPGDFTKDLGQLMSMILPPNASAELWVRQHGKPGWIERTLVRSTYSDRMDVHTLDDLGKEKAFTQPINPDKITSMATDIKNSAKAARWKDQQRKKAHERRPAPTTTQYLAARKSSTTSPTTGTQPAGETVARPNEPGPATPA